MSVSKETYLPLPPQTRKRPLLIEVDDTARRRILACTELAQLELWLGKAVTVQSVQELFKHKRTAKPSARTTGSHGRNLKARKPRARR